MLVSALRTQNSSDTVNISQQRAISSLLQPPQQLDVTIVFGEGPIKVLLLPDMVTPDQQVAWEAFKKEPLSANEPDFFVLEEPLVVPPFEEQRVAEQSYQAFSSLLQTAASSPSERKQYLEKQLLSCQHDSVFCLKKMGKQNALAAGMALITGMTKEIVITGGHTIPSWQKERFLAQMLKEERRIPKDEEEKQFAFYLKYFLRWPSEAELMAGVITRHFGKMYEEKFGRSIKSVMHLETNARNTIENITLSLRTYPQLFTGGKRIGLLSAEHHIERCAIIAHRFELYESQGARLSAQKLLYGQASEDEVTEHICLLDSIEQHEQHPEIKQVISNEKRWVKGLKDPHFLTYWFGYTFELTDPKRIVNVLHQFHDEKWRAAMQEAFQEVGLDFTSFTALDLQKLARADYQSFSQLCERLQLLIEPEYRAIPPPLGM